MLKLKKTVMVIFFIVVIGCIGLCGCNKNEKQEENPIQEVNYSEMYDFTLSDLALIPNIQNSTFFNNDGYKCADYSENDDAKGFSYLYFEKSDELSKDILCVRVYGNDEKIAKKYKELNNAYKNKSSDSEIKYGSIKSDCGEMYYENRYDEKPFFRGIIKKDKNYIEVYFFKLSNDAYQALTKNDVQMLEEYVKTFAPIKKEK